MKLLYTTVAMVAIACSMSCAQLMPLSGSPKAVKLLREAWGLTMDVHLKKANEKVNEAIKADPNFALAYLWKDFAINIDTIAREANIKKADELSGSLPEEEKWLIELMSSDQRRKAAVGYAPKLVEKYPKDKMLVTGLAFQVSSEKPDWTETWLKSILKEDKKFVPAHNLLGYLYIQQGDMEKAGKHFDEAIKFAPKEANPYDSKGDYLAKLGKKDEAILMFEKAYSMDPENMKLSKEKAEKLRE